MFTGIIEEIGNISSLNISGTSGSIKVNAFAVLQNTKLGDSIAVNGVCLTVTHLENNSFTADVMAETFRRTNLGQLSNGSPVNLERAMAGNGRFGGHIVSGHIDGTGTISKIQEESNATWYYINAPQQILNLVVEKGSIAIDGISLTVAYVDKSTFAVSIIPHTSSQTILSTRKVGDTVNLENDIIGKYVQKFMGEQNNNQSQKDSKILEWLSN